MSARSGEELASCDVGEEGRNGRILLEMIDQLYGESKFRGGL